MSRTFNFNDKKGEKLTLNGKDFYIDVLDIDFLSRVSDFEDGIEELKEADYSGLKSTEDLSNAVNSVISAYVKIIDGLLGEGSTLKIFGEREFTFGDITDLGMFIMEEVNVMLNDIEKVNVDKYSPQRIKK